MISMKTLNEGTNSRVTSELGWERWFIRQGRTNEHHETHNGWYSGMVALIFSIVDVLILYSRNILGQ